MNEVKTIFPESTNLLCQFHIDKNVKAKCNIVVGQKNSWDYVMEAWGSLVDCPCKQDFNNWGSFCIKKETVALQLFMLNN